jgi:hypothetical protein
MASTAVFKLPMRVVMVLDSSEMTLCKSSALVLLARASAQFHQPLRMASTTMSVPSIVFMLLLLLLLLLFLSFLTTAQSLIIVTIKGK